MTPRGPLKAIIFDFDGVIVESLGVKAEAFRELFADHPEHQDRIVKLHLDNLGVSRYQKFRTIYREFLGMDLGEEEVADLDRRFSELVYKRVISCAFVAGAPHLLERIHRDYSLSVASATPQDELARIVSARGLSGFFTTVRGSPATKAQIIGEILSNSATRPDEALMVGDAVTDSEAASQNGVPFVGRLANGGANPFSGAGVPTVWDLAELDRSWSQIIGRLGFAA